MVTVSLAFNVTALYIVAFFVVLILGYVLVKKHKDRAREGATRLVTDTIVDYFRKNEVIVWASCHSVLEDKRFVAIVESEPLKKFRCSYVIEQSLIHYVQQATGKQIDRVFWRFPLLRREPLEEQLPEAVQEALGRDPYLVDGVSQAKSDYKVEELPWEKFESIVQRGNPQTPGGGGT